MKVKLKKYGPLQWRLRGDEEIISLNRQLNMEQLLTEELGIEAQHIRFLRILLNGRAVTGLKTMINDSDEITLILPIGGG